MIMNKHKPHVYVIPEDDRDRQIADGFCLHYAVDARRIQVMPPANGWSHVRDTFRDEYVRKVQDNLNAHVVMLIDFDGHYDDRRAAFEKDIPPDIKSRVFVVGSKTTPETLRTVLNRSFENIGTTLANDCAAGSTVLWDHEQLSHNDADRLRLVTTVKPFLFAAEGQE